MGRKKKEVPKSDDGYYSLRDLTRIVGCDRTTLARVSKGAVSKDRGKHKVFRLDSILAALGNKPDKSLREQKLTEEIRKLKLANDMKENRLLDKSVFIGILQRILGPLDNLIEQKLVNEWPTAVAGLEPAAARV